MALPLQAQPWNDPVLVEKPWTMGFSWLNWFAALHARVAGMFTVQGSTPVALTAQAAALPATELIAVVPDGGALYRLSLHLQVTQAATTSSTITATVRWTASGVAQGRVLPLSSNTLGDSQAYLTLFAADEGTAVTVEVAYTSVGATSLQYRVDALLERAA